MNSIYQSRINYLLIKKASNLNFILPIIVFIISFLLKLFFLFNIYPNNRHSFGEYYGSTAIGIYCGEGPTYSFEEVKRLKKLDNNYSGNYLTQKSKDERKPLLYTLPGPAYTIALLWAAIPIYNFSTYIIFQIFLDSIIIAIFSYVFRNKIYKPIFYILLAFLILNPVAISKTLMVSYDFWAPFCVLVNFTGIYFAMIRNNNAWILLITGFITAITLWFRDIVNFLPFFIVISVFIYFLLNKKSGFKYSLGKSLIYLLPILFSIVSLSLYRYHNTGSYRPTQTFFWHAFFCAIGQFDNPYGIKPTDKDVWDLGKKLNSKIDIKNQFDLSESTNNIYEETLKEEGIRFIKQNPITFLRNMVYRTSMMISPPLFNKSTSPTKTLFNSPIIRIFGFLLIILWILGLIYLFKKKDKILFIIIPIYLYFFSIFSWYYLVGRVILCFAFINIILYAFGMKYLYEGFCKKRNISLLSKKK